MLRGATVGMRDLKGIFVSGRIGYLSISQNPAFFCKVAQQFDHVRSKEIYLKKQPWPPQCHCRECKRHVKIHLKKLYIHGLTYMHAYLKSS